MADDNENAAGFASLGQMLETIRSLPRALVVDAAPEVAQAMRDHLIDTIEAGTTPDGVSWAPRAKDGKTPLRNAARNVFAAALGSYVYIRVTGPEARHHLGTGKGRVKRQIIFEGTKLPAPVVREIQAIIARRFEQHMTGGGQ